MRNSIKSNNSARVKMLAYMAMMLAVMIVLSMIERLLPPPVPMAPTVRLGLSNVMTMYALFFLGRSQAFTLTASKALFITLIRGPMAGVVSAAAGLFSLLVIIVLLFASRGRGSYIILSVAGATAHNFAQLPVISLFPGAPPLGLMMAASWPFLLIFGIIFGAVTGTVLRVVMPYMDRLFIKR